MSFVLFLFIYIVAFKELFNGVYSQSSSWHSFVGDNLKHLLTQSRYQPDSTHFIHKIVQESQFKDNVNKDFDNFDCKVRALALEFANNLQPQRSPHCGKKILFFHLIFLFMSKVVFNVDYVFLDVFDALQLQLCNETRPVACSNQHTSPPLSNQIKSAIVVLNRKSNRSVCERDVDVPIDRVLSNLNDAVQHWQQLAPTSRRSTALLLCGGVHFLNKTVQLTREHSGLTMRSVPRQFAWLSGGAPLDALRFTPLRRRAVLNNGSVVDVAMWRTTLPSTADDDDDVSGVHQLEPSAQLVRARFPYADPETSIGGWLNASCASHWHRPPVSAGSGQRRLLLNLTDCRAFQPCKNNSAFAPYNTFTIGFDGYCSRWSPPTSFWCSDKCAGGWANEDQKVCMLVVKMILKQFSTYAIYTYVHIHSFIDRDHYYRSE
jgi:hypothetical protein